MTTRYFFPALIKYQDKDEPEFVSSPEDLRSGIAFRVLECNVTTVDSED